MSCEAVTQGMRMDLLADTRTLGGIFAGIPGRCRLHRTASLQRSEPTLKRTKARGRVQRDAKEVLAEVLGKLRGKLDAPAVSTRAKENRRGNTVGPNRDRLTGGSGSGRPLESVLHSWFGGRNAGRRTVADNAGRCKGVLPGIDRGAGSHRSGNSLGLGT